MNLQISQLSPSENDLHLPRSSNNILSSNNDASISAVNTLFALKRFQNLNIFLYRGWNALAVVITLCLI